MQHREILCNNRYIKINIQIIKYKLRYIAWKFLMKVATKLHIACVLTFTIFTANYGLKFECKHRKYKDNLVCCSSDRIFFVYYF